MNSPGYKRGPLHTLKRLCSEVWLLTWLTILLLSHFRIGYLWIQRMLLTFLYAALLSPALVQLTCYYYSGKVMRGIKYGRESRNFLDVYLPRSTARQATGHTSILYIPGGAWIIGYKGWAALLGRLLSSMGYIFIAVDHRNFPEGTISDMMQDVTAAITWTMCHVQQYGGDRSQVVLMGQSSGAHIMMLSLLQQLHTYGSQDDEDGAAGAEIGSSLMDDPECWQPNAIKLVIAVSGAYNVQSLVDHFDKRGLYRRVFMSIMEAGLTGSRASEALPKHSPVQLLRNRHHLPPALMKKLPPVLLVHGTADRTIPFSQTQEFAAALKQLGVSCRVDRLEGCSHTDPIMEDLLLWGPASPLMRIIRSIAPLPRASIPAALSRNGSVYNVHGRGSYYGAPELEMKHINGTAAGTSGSVETGSSAEQAEVQERVKGDAGGLDGGRVHSCQGSDASQTGHHEGGEDVANGKCNGGAGLHLGGQDWGQEGGQLGGQLEGFCFSPGRAKKGMPNSEVQEEQDGGGSARGDRDVWMPSPLVHLARAVVPF